MRRQQLEPDPDGREHWIVRRDRREVPNSLRRPVQRAFANLSAHTWSQIGTINLAQLAAAQLTPNGVGSQEQAKAAEQKQGPLAPPTAAPGQPGDVTIDLDRAPDAVTADGAEVWVPPDVANMTPEERMEAGLPAPDFPVPDQILDDPGLDQSWNLEDTILLAWIADWSFDRPVNELLPDGPRVKVPLTLEGLDELPAYRHDELAALFPTGLTDLFPDFGTFGRPGEATPTAPSSASA